MRYPSARQESLLRSRMSVTMQSGVLRAYRWKCWRDRSVHIVNTLTSMIAIAILAVPIRSVGRLSTRLVDVLARLVGRGTAARVEQNPPMSATNAWRARAIDSQLSGAHRHTRCVAALAFSTMSLHLQIGALRST